MVLILGQLENDPRSTKVEMLGTHGTQYAVSTPCSLNEHLLRWIVLSLDSVPQRPIIKAWIPGGPY